LENKSFFAASVPTRTEADERAQECAGPASMQLGNSLMDWRDEWERAMSVRKVVSAQADLFLLDAAIAKNRFEHSIYGRGRPWCALCRLDTLAIGEFYMVKDEVWDAAVGPDSFIRGSFLCIGCLELRLGRRLAANDFTDSLLNKKSGHESPRLRDRLSRQVKPREDADD
jgi:hypothetical protein